MPVLLPLFDFILKSAASWAVGKALDVSVICLACRNRQSARIGNRQLNTLSCTNCHQALTQYTNACAFTVSSSGRIGHVTAAFHGRPRLTIDPLDGKRYPGWLFCPTQMRARHLHGRQVVVSGRIIDYERDTVLSKTDWLHSIPGKDCTWRASRIAMRWDAIPEEARDTRIFAIELLIRSEFRHELYRSRLLTKLWHSQPTRTAARRRP